MDARYVEFWIENAPERIWNWMLLTAVTLIEFLEAIYASACTMSPAQAGVGIGAIATLALVSGLRRRALGRS